MALDAFQKRLNLMEKSHCDTLEIQTRHEHWWKATQARLDGFQAQLVEDHRSRDGLQVGIRDQLARKSGDTETQLASMKERVDYVEILLGQSGDHNAKGFEVIKAAYARLAGELERMGDRMNTIERNFADKQGELHGRLSEEQKTRMSHHSSMSSHQSTQAERVAALERSLGVHAGEHVKGLSETNSKLDQLHSQLHGRLDAHHSTTPPRRSAWTTSNTFWAKEQQPPRRPTRRRAACRSARWARLRGERYRARQTTSR